MPVATFPLGPLQTNSYLIHTDSRAVAVDVGGHPAPMLNYLAEQQLSLAAICLTHRHFDHLYGVAELGRCHHGPGLRARWRRQPGRDRVRPRGHLGFPSGHAL